MFPDEDEFTDEQIEEIEKKKELDDAWNDLMDDNDERNKGGK